MLTDRIIGAFIFRKGVYAEVEADTSFTSTAWILVVVFAFLNQLGSYASENLFDWLIGTAIGTLTAVIAFAVAAVVMNWVGKALFKAEVTFDELVRTMGLASVWTVVGVLGVIAAFSTALSCLLGPGYRHRLGSAGGRLVCGRARSPGPGLGTDHYHRHYWLHPLGDHYGPHRGGADPARPDSHWNRRPHWHLE